MKAAGQLAGLLGSRLSREMAEEAEVFESGQPVQEPEPLGLRQEGDLFARGGVIALPGVNGERARGGHQRDLSAGGSGGDHQFAKAEQGSGERRFATARGTGHEVEPARRERDRLLQHQFAVRERDPQLIEMQLHGG